MKKRLICISIILVLFAVCLFSFNKQVKAEEIEFDTVFNNSVVFISNRLNSGAYYLEEDVSISEKIIIESGNTVYLDIKGHKLTGTMTNEFFNIEEGATLKIYDSGTNSRYFTYEEDVLTESSTSGYYFVQGGYFTMASNAYSRAFENEGTLEVNDVSFVGFNSSSSSIAVNTNQATFNNCEFYYNKAQSIIYNNGILECNSCIIYDNKLEYHVLSTYNDVTINSCDIRYNTMYIATIEAYEGNVLITGSSSIANNYNTSNECGAVYIREDATITLGGSTFIRTNFYQKDGGESIERNVTVENNSLSIEKDQDIETISKGFSVGFTLIGENRYDCFEGEGIITSSLSSNNLSNYFIADNHDYTIVGKKDNDGKYSLYQEKMVISEPTEENPTYTLNLDDNDEAFYNWFKVERSEDYFYFDESVKAQKYAIYSSTPGKWTIKTGEYNNGIEFDAEAETKLSFDVLKDESISNITVALYIDKEYQAVLKDYCYDTLSSNKHYEFSLPRRGHYKLVITTGNKADVEIENLCSNSFVPDYDNDLSESTDTFSKVDTLSGKYICEVMVGERVYTSNFLLLKSKISKEPTIEDPSVGLMLEDEDNKVEYNWYYYSYEKETSRFVDSSEILMTDDDFFIDGTSMYFVSNGFIYLNLKKGERVYPIIDESNGYLKKYYSQLYVKIYNDNFSKTINLFNNESSITVDKDGEYCFIVYFVQDYDEHQEELTYINMKLEVKTGGYKKEFLLENEKEGELKGNYPVGIYGCEIVIDSKETLVTNLINYGAVEIKAIPTEDDLTFEIDNENFTYQWYFINNNQTTLIENATSKTLDSKTLIGEVYCVASYGDLHMKSDKITVSYRITKQPTKEDTSIKLNTTNEEVYYAWYKAEYAYEEWSPLYNSQLDNEYYDHLIGTYPYGDYICSIMIRGESRMYDLLSDVVSFGYLEYEMPTSSDPTVIYNNDSGIEEEITWYQYGTHELKDHVIIDKDYYKSDTFFKDSWCLGEYINGKWFLSKEYMYMEDGEFDGYPVISMNFQLGAILKIKVYAEEDVYFGAGITNYNDVSIMSVSNTLGKYCEFTFTFPEAEDGETYIFVFAYTDDGETYDIKAEFVIDNMTIEDYLCLVDEKSATLSSKKTRSGYYLALLEIGDYCKEFGVYFGSRIVEDPSEENDYKVELITQGEEIEYRWYGITDERVKLTDQSSNLTLNYATYEDGVFKLSAEGADLIRTVDGNFHKLNVFTINAKAGESLYYTVFNEETNQLFIEIQRDGTIVYVMPYYFYIDNFYTFEEDGEYEFYAYGLRGSYEAEIVGVNIEASYGKYEVKEIEEYFNKASLDPNAKNGYYQVEVTFKDEYGGQGIATTEVFFYCTHKYDISYVWDENGNKVTAKAVCSICSKEITEEASITSEITKEATCIAKGIKIYKAEFESKTFSVQTKEEDLAVEENKHCLVKFEAVSPTYEEEGHEEYYVCEHCHKFFKDVQGLEEIDPISVIIDKLVKKGCKSSIGSISLLSLSLLLSLGYFSFKKKRVQD